MEELQTLTPRQIVAELDKYIIGQNNAKRSVAIALRNRWRRQRVGDKLREEIMPNNIILIGPTGVGKTEIARRLSKLAHAPFIKVEASKFTEVGYVGRDVESMIRDLADLAVAMVRSEKTATVQEQAEKLANERIVDLLMPSLPQQTRMMNAPSSEAEAEEAEKAMEEEALKLEERRQRSRDKMRKKLLDREMEDKLVEMDVASDGMPMMQVITPIGVEELGINLQDMVGNLFPKKMKRRKMKVSEARPFLTQEEAQKLIDMDQVVKEAVSRVENSGIVFLDEIDKIAGVKNTAGPDVSREGVQRDLLPVVEGTNVFTKYGMVKTDHVLFIASGAFHVSKPSDLIPELQGRFPIRVELQSLTAEDFVRILTEPENALLKQYLAMLETEGIQLAFEKDAIAEIANIASAVNEKTENIGARRLHTVLTALLEDILFNVPDQLDSLDKPDARGDKQQDGKQHEKKDREEQTDKAAREKLADSGIIIERLDQKHSKKPGTANASDERAGKEVREAPIDKDAPHQPEGQEATKKQPVAKITITAKFVNARLKGIVEDEDLSRYIL